MYHEIIDELDDCYQEMEALKEIEKAEISKKDILIINCKPFL